LKKKIFCLTFEIKLGREGYKMSDTTIVEIELENGYKFRVKFDASAIPDLIVDEAKPLGENSGPTPTMLLSAAIGHCLSASLLFCLKKARIEVNDLKTTVKTSVARNDAGYLRINNSVVQIDLDVGEENRARVQNCLRIFENYCTVTQSVRKGIDIAVNFG
jgi:uncharacterized OsmC-like protein